ncbi:hypothetical protein NMG60_11030001 [Bertholletia excelsa]
MSFWEIAQNFRRTKRSCHVLSLSLSLPFEFETSSLTYLNLRLYLSLPFEFETAVVISESLYTSFPLVPLKAIFHSVRRTKRSCRTSRTHLPQVRVIQTIQRFQLPFLWINLIVEVSEAVLTKAFILDLGDFLTNLSHDLLAPLVTLFRSQPFSQKLGTLIWGMPLRTIYDRSVSRSVAVLPSKELLHATLFLKRRCYCPLCDAGEVNRGRHEGYTRLKKEGKEIWTLIAK